MCPRLLSAISRLSKQVSEGLIVEVAIGTPRANPASRRDAALNEDRRGPSGSIEAVDASKAASNRRMFIK